MNVTRLLTANLAGEAEPLLDLVNAYFQEAMVFGRMCRTDEWDFDGGKQHSRVRYYCEAREIPFLKVTAVLEDTIGLQFTDAAAQIPYRHVGATWPPGCPLAGHVTVPSKLSPFTWLSTFFVHWNLVPDDDSAREGEYFRVLRSTLWICHESGLRAAVDYVADLVETGQVVSVFSAIMVVAQLIIVSARTDSPQELVASLMDGRLPRKPDEWLIFYPTLENAEPVRLTADGRAAVESLVVRGWSQVEKTRAASSLDEWLSSVAALQGLLTLVMHSVAMAVANPSTALRAVVSQFEELSADIFAATVDMEVGLEGNAGLPQFLSYQRDLEKHFLNRGDTSGRRFRRERLLLPLPIYGSSDELPPDWGEPSWRIALPWKSCHSFVDELLAGPDPTGPLPRGSWARPLKGDALRQALTLHPEHPPYWKALAQELRSAGRPRAAKAALLVSKRMSQRTVEQGWEPRS
ncbi:hypothetical protein ABT116_20365 [Streptomyces sp. NPDC002130]|uniref:tetratricopeptide repeat protein n=1 Tax=Streptomyces sp. NPDC002130 TaxID=3155568 RepID=UPI00331B285F